MVTDHRDACRAAGRPSAVWWPLSSDGKIEKKLELTADLQSKRIPSQTWEDAHADTLTLCKF